jgi:hypothetical protein
MTWYGDDKGLQWVSHRLVALLMGGCIYTHVAVSKRWMDSMGAVLFLAFSIIVPWAEGRETLDHVVPAHLALAMLGWLIGTMISRSQPDWREWEPPVWVPVPRSNRPVKKKRGIYSKASQQQQQQQQEQAAKESEAKKEN